MEEKKEVFQWVMTMSEGDQIFLTESQYDHYKANWEDGKMFFKTLEVNPSFVVSAIKQPAKELKQMYPCLKCQTTGKSLGKICPNCEGSGVDTTNA